MGSVLTWRSGLVALGVVVVGAAIVGGLTPYGQRYLPHALTSFANSTGSWTGLTFFYSAPFGGVVAPVAVLAGPVVGFAAGLVRSHAALRRVVGCAVPAAVLVGEGVYGLTRIADTTSPIYWSLQIAAGVAIAIVVPLRTRVTMSTTALGLVITAVGAAAFYAFYTVIL